MSNIESCWELNPLRIFPNYILDELGIDHIKFNSIPITIMTKSIKRIFSFLNIKPIGNNLKIIKEIALIADGKTIFNFITKTIIKLTFNQLLKFFFR